MNSGVVNNPNRQVKNSINSVKTKKSLFAKATNASVLTIEEQELLKVALEARDEWIENNSNFEHVNDELLIDYYTYRIKASEARYAYFLQLIKEKGLTRYL